jgi:hypothetical protein
MPEVITKFRRVPCRRLCGDVIKQAYLGIAVPVGGDATPFDHNSGATESEYTSWSIDKTVANYYGSKKGEGGVVLTKDFKVSELTPSPDQYSEGEVLVRGVVGGATVEDAKGGSPSTQFTTK